MGTGVATNKQGIRRRTGRYSKVAGAWGRPSVHLGLMDIRVKHRGWAGRNCFVPSLPVSEDTSPAHTVAVLGLHDFRMLRLRRCLWYEVIQLVGFLLLLLKN